MADGLIWREAELTLAIDLMRQADEAGEVLDVVGLPGSGKDTFLTQLEKRAGTLGELTVRPLRLDFSELGIAETYHGDHGAAASVGMLLATLSESAHRLTRLSDETDMPYRFTGFRELCTAVLDRELSTENVEAAKERVRRWQLELDEKFLESWGAWLVHEPDRALLTVRGVDCINDNELGAWLGRLAHRLPRTLTVLSRTSPEPQALPAPGRHVHRCALPWFSEKQTAWYLQDRFPGHELPEGVPSVVHSFTGGHPGGVSLAAALVSELDTDDRAPDRLRRILRRLPPEPMEKWGSLVHLVLDAVRDPLLRDAVDICAVVTTFDEPLLAELLAAGGREAGGQAGRVIDTLLAFGLIEPVTTEDEQGRYRLHEYIRVSLEHKRTTRGSLSWQELHQAAADYCGRQMTEMEDSDSGPYTGWHRYEHPRWKSAKREWLYHSAQTVGDDWLTRGRLTLVFLEAFFWWGCYVRFDFNHELLQDWERHANVSRAGSGRSADLRRNDELLGEQLSFVLANYPLGPFKTDAPWWEIRKALLRVEQLCGVTPGISGGRDLTSDERDRLDGLLAIFLAHTTRFADPADTRTDDDYQVAQDRFAGVDDWVVAWVDLERADLEIERGNPAGAVARVGSAARTMARLVQAGDRWDEELLANLHRIRADALWLSGQPAEALQWHAGAVRHAYRYLRLPDPPDRYTQAFYVEQTTRAARRLQEYAELESVDEARIAALELRAVLPGGAGSPDELAELLTAPAEALGAWLFLRGPRDDELGQEVSDFLDEWSEFHRRHRATPDIGQLFAPLASVGDQPEPVDQP